MKRNLKSISAVALALTLLLSACSSDVGESAAQPKKDGVVTIGILQLVEHDALDAARKGFLAGLEEAGYTDGDTINVDFQNAQNDQANLKTMSQRFVNNKVDLILGIATPAAQSLASETTTIPILGTAITDFAAAGLVATAEKPGGNVTGVTDETPVGDQFELLKKILPDAKTVGIMYNSSEVNSQVQAEAAIAAAKKVGLTAQTATVTSTNDVAQAVQSVCEKVDVLYIPTDNTFASTMATVGQISLEAKVPVIVGEKGLCKGGGLATVGIDYFSLGQQTGALAVRVLKGENPSELAVESPKKNDVAVNLDAAKSLGITIPKDIVDSAKMIIENGEVKEK